MRPIFPKAEPDGKEPVPPFAVDAALAPAQDPLLDCLDHVARHYGKAISRSVFTAGLPLAEGVLTPQLFPDAAARAGLSAKIAKRNLSQLTSLLLPAVLLLKSGQPVVLRALTKRNATIVVPETGGGQSTIPLRELNKEYSGYAILAKPEFEMRGEQSETRRNRSKSWFWGSVAPLWPSYMQVFVAAAFVNVLGLAAPLFIMNVYDRVLPNKALTTLWVLAVGMGAAILFDFVFKSLRNSLIGNAGRRADVILASNIFEHVLHLDLGRQSMRTGELANKIRDYEVVREFFTSNTIVTMTDLAFVGLYIFIIYQIAGPIAYIPALAFLIVLIAGLIIQYPLSRVVRSAQTEAGQRHSILIEALNGFETIKTCRAEGQMLREWQQFVRQNAGTAHRVRTVTAFGMNFTSFIQQLVTVAVVVVGVHMFDQGDISPGALIASVILAGRGVAPLAQLAGTLARTQHAVHAFSSLNAIMKSPTEGSGQARHVDKDIKSGRFAFQNVKFTYPGASQPTINGFNLTVRAGERIGIIGKIGSGKTTVGRLLTSLLYPTEGSLMIDGLDARQYHPAEIRRQVVFVSQDSTLFSGSLRENIAFGSPNVSDEAVIKAAELAGLADWVNANSAGYNLQVGEGGSFLSSGQRQCVCLARAFLSEPSVLFLDEPTGTMDMASEKAFIEKLRAALKPSQTLVLATHRFRPLSLIDRLVVLDRGRVIADGPRDDVLKKFAPKQRVPGN